MRYWRCLLGLAALLAGGLAGCPVTPDSGLESTPGGGVAVPSGGSSGGSSGSVTTTQSFEEQLRDEFPSCGEPINADEWRAEILRLVNVERSRAGLDPLEHDQTLENQATRYACEMIQYDFFAHVNPVTGSTLRDRAAEFGYDYVAIGENLAAGQSSPAQVMADWMSSPGHRENILSPHFTELGIGIRSGGRYGTYWVQEFGRPRQP